MKLTDVIADADVLIALEPEELGLRILPVLCAWERNRNFSPNITLSGLFQAANDIPDPSAIGGRTESRNNEIKLALREAWARLEGAALIIRDDRFLGEHEYRTLSRKAKKLASEPDARRALSSRRIQKDMLNPRIRDDVWSLYHRGKYDTAVFEAMKAVEVAVRETGDFTAKEIGVALMRKAFDPEIGPLTDKGSEKAERDARSALFAGAIGAYKNPHSHRNVALDDPDEAAEIILLANHLLRIVDSRIPTEGLTRNPGP